MAALVMALVGAGAVAAARAGDVASDAHANGVATTTAPGAAERAAALLAALPVGRPPKPEPCRTIAAGASIQDALAAASDGDALCLVPGTYMGPLVVAKSVTLWGPPESVVQSNGEGTTVRVIRAAAQLLGFTVVGSGPRYDKQDAGVLVSADRVRVEGVTIRDAVFGITAERAHGITIRGNRITARREPMLGLRGDGVRLWEVYDSTVEDNAVVDARDVVVWYSSRNRIAGNVITGSRYGTHFMYSHENVVAGNRYVGNVVGVFLMYSRNVELRDNLIAASGGAAGIGIGLKESSGVTVAGNTLVKNTVGVYVDGSPFVPGMTNHFTRNLVRLGGTGILFHASPHECVFEGNSFRDNFQHARVDGGGNARDVEWRGNDFDDYVGYDLDGDGFGDVPYELRSLANRLTSTYPELAFLHGTPTLAMVEAVSFLLPLFAPETLLVDPKPRLLPLVLGAQS